MQVLSASASDDAPGGHCKERDRSSTQPCFCPFSPSSPSWPSPLTKCLQLLLGECMCVGRDDWRYDKAEPTGIQDTRGDQKETVVTVVHSSSICSSEGDCVPGWACTGRLWSQTEVLPTYTAVYVLPLMHKELVGGS